MKRIYKRPEVESEVLERTALTCIATAQNDNECDCIGNNLYTDYCSEQTAIRGGWTCVEADQVRSG